MTISSLFLTSLFFILSIFNFCSTAYACSEEAQLKLRTAISDIVLNSELSDPDHKKLKDTFLKHNPTFLDHLKKDEAEQKRCLNLAFSDVPAVKKFLNELSDSPYLIPGKSETFSFSKFINKDEILKSTVGDPTGNMAYDYFIDQVAKNINKTLTQLDVNEMGGVTRILDRENGGIDFGATPINVQNLIKTSIKNYFENISPEMRRRVVSGYLKLRANDDNDAKLAAILNNSGPILQKIFQLMASDNENSRIQKILQSMKTGITPMPLEELDEAMKKNYQKKWKSKFSGTLFGDESISAGSVGQAHYAAINKKLVVVKVLREGLIQRAHDELTALRNIAIKTGDQRNIDLVNSLGTTVLEELNFGHEYSNMEKGQRYYEDPKKYIHVIRGIEVSGHQNALIMEMAEGKSLSTLKGPQYRCVKAQALSRMLDKWTTQSLFGVEGFFHADLHAGNMFLDVDKSDYRKSKLTLIDFGNCYSMTPEEQKYMTRLLIGVNYRSPKLIMQGILQADKEPILPQKDGTKVNFEGSPQETKMLQFLKEKVKEGDPNALTQILDYALENFKNIKIPQVMVQFNRGNSFLSAQLEQVRNEIQKEKDTEPKCEVPQSPASIQSSAFIRGAKWKPSWFDQTVLSEIRKNSSYGLAHTTACAAQATLAVLNMSKGLCSNIASLLSIPSALKEKCSSSKRFVIHSIDQECNQIEQETQHNQDILNELCDSNSEHNSPSSSSSRRSPRSQSTTHSIHSTQNAD